MKFNTVKPSNLRTGRPVAADRGKVMLAGGLVLVMVLLWARVFLKGKPAPANAAAQTPAAQAAQSSEPQKPQTKVVYVELPYDSAVDSVIGRNFFDASNWDIFKHDNVREERADTSVKKAHIAKTSILATQTTVNEQDGLVEAAKRLRLSAIVVTEQPEAVINGRIIGLDSTIILRSSSRKYELKVTDITTDGVVLSCGKYNLNLFVDEIREPENDVFEIRVSGN